VGFPRIQNTHTHTHTHSSNITSQEIPIEINNQHKALDFYPLIVDFELEQLMFNKDSKFLTTDLAWAYIHGWLENAFDSGQWKLKEINLEKE